MTAEQLQAKMLNEQLGSADELSPTELYDLLASKAKLIGASCKSDRQTPQAQPKQTQAEPAQARVVKPERFFESKKSTS
jgi:hypothetical protein